MFLPRRHWPLRPSATHLLSLLGAALFSVQVLAAQTLPAPPDSTRRIYTYAEQMPEMPGMKGGLGMGAKIRELMKPTVIPKGGGKVYVSFVVGPQGEVYGPIIVRGISAAVDAAVLDAVLRLPRFVPGRYGGKPVAVAFTVPVMVK